MSSIDQESPQPGERLYRHSKREKWGFAVLAWERDGKRGYQFEDGQMRVFAEGFYRLIKEADCPPEQASRLLIRLGRQSGVGKGSDGKIAERQLTFEEQLHVLLSEYPGGFLDPNWKNRQRGEGVSRRLKRHRDFSMAEAQELLSPEALAELIKAGDHEEVVRRLTEVVHGSDLTTRAQAEPISKATPSPELTLGLRDLLYGSGDYEPRFDEFCRLVLEAGRKQLSWPLATAIAAQVLPDAHVAVRPTVLAKQAVWAYPRLRYSTKPEGKVYTRILTMARTVRESLAAAGYPPKDLLDVYDFMQITLRPAATKLLDEVRHRLAMEEIGEAATPPVEVDEADEGDETKAAAAPAKAAADGDADDDDADDDDADDDDADDDDADD